MLKFSGERLNLSSGMASAASTICFSIALISASMADLTVGCACCAPGAFVAEVLFSLGLKAVTPKMSNPSGKKIRICFIRVTPFDLFWPTNLWPIGTRFGSACAVASREQSRNRRERKVPVHSSSPRRRRRPRSRSSQELLLSDETTCCVRYGCKDATHEYCAENRSEQRVRSAARPLTSRSQQRKPVAHKRRHCRLQQKLLLWIGKFC